jgi:hypothetical protein
MVRDEELGVRAVEHDHVQRAGALDQLDQLSEFGHGCRSDRVDRWMIEGDSP